MTAMDMGLAAIQDHEIINGRTVVKKHVATIHCSNKLSLLERKISNALLFHAFPNLKQQMIHEIKIDDLKCLIGANTRNHFALREALKKLISTILEWNLLGDSIPELEGWNASTILSSVSVTRGVIKYQYSELIKTLIIDPKIYGKINLTIQARFKSSYALALYENCSRYRGLPYTKDMGIAIFRKLMGVEDGKYGVFRDFNRRVLNQAISEINTCSDIRITPEITRAGRAVKSIKFKLEERSIKQRIGMLAGARSGDAGDKHYEENAIEKFVQLYGKEKVSRAVKYVQSRPAYKNGEIKNLSGYIKSAIDHSYEEKNKLNVAAFEDEAVLWRKYRDDYYRYITEYAMNQFLIASDEGNKKAISEFFDNGHTYINNFYRKEHVALTAYQKLGDSVNGLKAGIDSKDKNAIIFFDNGFTEFLCRKYRNVKESAPAFREYMLRKNGRVFI